VDLAFTLAVDVLVVAVEQRVLAVACQPAVRDDLDDATDRPSSDLIGYTVSRSTVGVSCVIVTYSTAV